MKQEPPHWHPYDPADPPPDIVLRPESSLVVLLATTGAEAGHWAARASISLARRWAEQGRRVFLADLGLSRPELHAVLGEANGEGVSDALLYGASLRRIAHAHEGGFFFAPAGTPVASAERVLSSRRWGVLSQGFARARAQFLVYLPQGEPGHGALLARADQVVVLAAPGGRTLPPILAGDGERVAAVLWPPHGAPPKMPERPGPEALSDSPAPSERRPAPRPGAPRPPTRGRERSSSRTMILVLVALLLGLLVLWALGILRLPGSPAEAGEAGGVTATGLGLPPSEAAAGFSLTLGSYRDAAVAHLQAEALSRERPELLFVVAPVQVDGELFHRLLVGPSSDATAAGLRAELSRTLTQEDPSGWVVRETPLAFHLARYATLEEARARAAELSLLEVPAYVLEDAPPGETHAFDVWAGAYADSLEASWLGHILEGEDVVASLKRRRGRPPA